jgi:predicted metal-dependent peptidase
MARLPQPDRDATLLKKIAKARTSLIIDHPFIGTIALNMPMTLDDNQPTACTNGKRVLFNRNFIEPLTDEEMQFLVAHECLHPMLEHNARRNNRHARKWNRAADYVINQLLVDDKIGKFIEGGCLDKGVYDRGGGTSDGIYNILPEEPEGDGGGVLGGTGDDLEDAPGSLAEVEQLVAEMKVTVAQAAQAAKLMGKLSVNQARLVEEVLNPKVDWRTVLRRFVEKAKNDTRTWSRPNRRFLAQGMYLPSIGGEALGELAIAVDCSGSIGDKEIAEFAAEITNIWDDQKPVKLHVIYFDSKVCHYEKFERDDSLHIEPHGGGGTAFSPVFKYQEDNAIVPVATIFLTDLCCSDFGPMPDHPVLWVSNHSDQAPWGEVVMM